VSVSGGDAYTMVALASESDVYTYDQLRSTLEAEATKGVPLLIVDLSALEFMDSTGVQVLLDIRVMRPIVAGSWRSRARRTPSPGCSTSLVPTSSSPSIPALKKQSVHRSRYVGTPLTLHSRPLTGQR